MTVSDNTGCQQKTNNWIRLLGQLSRYDIVLAVIPLVFALALYVHLLVGISMHVTVRAGAVLSAVLVVDALYVHPPAGGVNSEAQSAPQQSRNVGHTRQGSD